jgi:hypothetical protein
MGIIRPEKESCEMRNVYSETEYTSIKDSLMQQLLALQNQFGDSASVREKILEHDKTLMDRFQNIY